ncbi:hypothetical protein RCO27_07530 [Sphingosinicella sp. LHD-64]|uniref:hypothetical protein n=1 Tax=Sphingosinicella sp. LHD-64 TaxID=3072139 RepID=UPI00280C496D|nr:hypothetical protein [Sphingosinicella sp. LHD-64]MDQ8756079.1 hypothetical protein [Sphingosinicella sp. LHD-64]
MLTLPAARRNASPVADFALSPVPAPRHIGAMDQARAYIWLPHAGEVPARAVRFAVADRARQLVSGAWTVIADRHGAFHVAGAGGFGLARLAIRRRGLAFSQSHDGTTPLVARGIASPGPRTSRWIPAPGTTPWHALSISFPAEYLRRTPGAPGDPGRRPMIQLPVPEPGRMYRIAFLVTDSAFGRIDYEDRSDRYLGRVTDGRSRSLLILARVVDSDLAALSARLSRLSPQAPLRLFSRTGAPAGDERGLLFPAAEADHLDLVELHNLYRPPLDGPAPARQLRLPLDHH